MASQISICQGAARIIGASRVTALDGSTEVVIQLADAWDGVRDAELAAHPWVFALSRKALAASADGPPFGYQYGYPLPVDCLRVVEVTNLHRKHWVIERSGAVGAEVKSILTNFNSGQELHIRYIAKVTAVGDWSPWFCKAMEAHLAAEICERITQSDSKMEVALGRYSDAIKTARRTDAIEEPPQESPVDDWILARGDYNYDRLGPYGYGWGDL